MKQVNLNGKEVLLVELPEGAVNPTIIQSHSYFYSPRIEHSIGGIDLPTDDDWHFAFASPLSPTEDEASFFVSIERGFTTWYFDYITTCYASPSAIESLHSRIRSEGFEQPERVVLLTKK